MFYSDPVKSYINELRAKIAYYERYQGAFDTACDVIQELGRNEENLLSIQDVTSRLLSHLTSIIFKQEHGLGTELRVTKAREQSLLREITRIRNTLDETLSKFHDGKVIVQEVSGAPI